MNVGAGSDARPDADLRDSAVVHIARQPPSDSRVVAVATPAMTGVIAASAAFRYTEKSLPPQRRLRRSPSMSTRGSSSSASSARLPWAGILALLLLVPAAVFAMGQFRNDESAAIDYANTAPTDPVAQLQKRIDSGEVKLTYEPK